MKQKTIVAFFAALVLCLSLSTAAFAAADDISFVTYTPADLNVDVIFKNINPDTSAESTISGDTVSANTASNVLEMLLVAKSDINYTTAEFAVSYDTDYLATATVSSKKAAATGTLVINDATGTGRNVIKVNAISSDAVACANGDVLLKVYFNPQQDIPVTELKNHIALEALNNRTGEAAYGVSKCRTYLIATDTETTDPTQYMISTTYFPSAVTAVFDDTALSTGATAAAVKGTVSLTNTYNVSGEAVTDFELYKDAACEDALGDADLTFGANMLYVKTAFGGIGSVTVNATKTPAQDFVDAINALDANETSTMSEDLDLGSEVLSLDSGKKINLSGHNLTADSLTLTGGAMIYGEGRFYGELNMSADAVATTTGSNGGWMPLKHTDDGTYYTFVNVGSTDIKDSSNSQKLQNADDRSQYAGIIGLNTVFKDNMKTIRSSDYDVTLSVTVTTDSETVNFNGEDYTAEDGKVTFELNLNTAIDAVDTVNNVYLVMKKGDGTAVEFTGLSYFVTIRNDMFSKVSNNLVWKPSDTALSVISVAGFNWVAFE